jgi:hypothetical protein
LTNPKQLAHDRLLVYSGHLRHNSHDLWYSGGGAFQPWTFGYNGRPSNGATGLATLYDISADYQWTRGLATGLYFGYARGGAVVEHIFPENSDAKLGFLEVNYRF